MNAVDTYICAITESVSAVSTARDVKRIHRNNAGASTIRKLLECSQQYTDDLVRGGILYTIRNISRDTLFSKEIFKQGESCHSVLRALPSDFNASGLHSFVFRCIDENPEDTELRRVAILNLFELTLYTYERDHSQELALEGLPRLARMFLDYINPRTEYDASLLQGYVGMIPNLLSRLSSYRIMHDHHLSHATLHSLQLPLLAMRLMQFLDVDHASVRLTWQLADDISSALVWIAYYQTEAILGIPSNKGVKAFIAFMLSPSVTLRCRGLMGLLNTHLPDYSDDCQETRFCNPQIMFSLREIEGPEERMRNVVEAAIKNCTLEPGTEESYEEILTKHLNPLTRTPHHRTQFQAYESALRLVEFILHGPQTIDESFAFPSLRIVQSNDITDSMHQDMITALKFHRMYYEADVLQLDSLLYYLKQKQLAQEDPEHVVEYYMYTRHEVAKSLKRWPNKCYFYYAMIKSQTGHAYVNWATKGLQCSDCTPHLERQIYYETAFNLFGLGVTEVALCTSDPKWWTRGAQALRQADEHISKALQLLVPGSAEERLMVGLRLITSRLTHTTSQSTDHFKDWVSSCTAFSCIHLI